MSRLRNDRRNRASPCGVRGVNRLAALSCAHVPACDLLSRQHHRIGRPATVCRQFIVQRCFPPSWRPDLLRPTNFAAVFRQAASYVGRILKGEKPATCRSSSRPSSSWSSISRPPRRSASHPADVARHRRRGDRMKRRDFITLLGGAAALAACGARAAAGDAGDRISPQHVARRLDAPCDRVPPGPERNRLRRGSERRDRIPLGGRPQ